MFNHREYTDIFSEKITENYLTKTRGYIMRVLAMMIKTLVKTLVEIAVQTLVETVVETVVTAIKSRVTNQLSRNS
jgi:hypothetical protein